MRAALERAGMKSDWPAEPQDTGGVFIHVTVGVGAEERPAELGFATLGSWVGNDSLLAARTGRRDGWDYRRSPPRQAELLGPRRHGDRGGGGRDVRDGRRPCWRRWPRRVRDRIPDLPFVDPNAASAVPPGPDPCSVLSREEAEAVLGQLVVAPYRVREGGALADPGGRSCAYYTGKHRALVLTPHFSDGADEMRFVRARGGLGAVGVVDREAEAADTLEGPWDEVAIGVVRPARDAQGRPDAGDRLPHVVHRHQRARSGSPEPALRSWRPRADRPESALPTRRRRRLTRVMPRDTGPRRPRAVLRGAGPEPARRLATHRARRARRGADGRADERGDLAARVRRALRAERSGGPGLPDGRPAAPPGPRRPVPGAVVRSGRGRGRAPDRRA